MATITGLSSARMIAIEAASIVDGEIVGDNLILTRFDTTTVDAGDVRGPQGIQGPVGEVSDAELAAAIAAIAPGTWQAFSFNVEWESYGGIYRAANYRKFYDNVELTGTVKYIGTEVISGNKVIATLPVGFRPTATHTFGAFRSGGPAVSGKAIGEISVEADGDIILTMVDAEGPLSTNNRVSLSGFIFPIT